MKSEVYSTWKDSIQSYDSGVRFCLMQSLVSEPAKAMGLAPGGLMRQEIYRDRHGLSAWDTTAMTRCYVHLVNSEQFCRITGHAPPDRPVTAKAYTDAGLPWFEYYDADQKALEGAKPLLQLDSVAARTIKMGEEMPQDNEPVQPKEVVVLGPKDRVSEGQW